MCYTPWGGDAFGLPAENHALKTGIPPAESTRQNVAEFRRQLSELGAMYDSSREVNTAEPRFFRSYATHPLMGALLPI